MLLEIHEPGQTPIHHAQDIAIGIDLGTTNSLVAFVAEDGAVQVLNDEDGGTLLPSVVAYAADGAVQVGRVAVRHPQAIHSVKRLMGRGIADVKTLGEALPYALAEEKSAGMAMLEVDGRRISPVEISAEILKALKARAAAAFGHDVTQAVITVPAYFDDAARQATKDAAQLAGLEVLRLVNEPTAAALAYGLDNASEGLYAVYDLGGGTFDISLLKMEKGVFRVLSAGGDAQLGGDDFDHMLAELMLKKAGYSEELSAAQAGMLLQQARNVKEQLTDKDEVLTSVPLIGEFIITRNEFENAIKPLVNKTIKAFNQVLVDAEIEPEDVKGVVMVGGSTRVPIVQQMVAAFIGKQPLNNLNPDEVVAQGAAIQASALAGGSNDTLLLDVTPLSLGVETYGGLMEVIIPRNSAIPCSVAQEFTTQADNQTGMQVHIVQGEREMVDLCRSLARFELKGIPPMPAGKAVIAVTFTIDADGLLTVSAMEKTTAIIQEITVKPSYGLAPEAMERMLMESMEHAQEDITRRLLAESRIEAEQGVAAVRRALEVDGALISSDYCDRIEAQIASLLQASEGEDRDAIDLSAAALNELCAEFAEARMNKALGVALQGSSVQEVEQRLAAIEAKKASQN